MQRWHVAMSYEVGAGLPFSVINSPWHLAAHARAVGRRLGHTGAERTGLICCVYAINIVLVNVASLTARTAFTTFSVYAYCSGTGNLARKITEM